MHRVPLAWSLGVVAAAAVLGLNERLASACGGCFHPPEQTATDITDERMLLSVSPTQTTLFDQIQYTGNPSSFAWVLPIHGNVSVGLSADVMFDSVDTLTTTTIPEPTPDCPAAPSCAGQSTVAAPGECAGGACGTPNNNGGAGSGAVMVTKQQTVGPYATVQLKSTSPTALASWLTTNGYAIPADAQPVIAQYIAEGFDFLAMKLLPGQGVQSMRPVRVSMPGASLSLPLRMASIGTGATVGITVWVVSDGRYAPQNFPSFHIEDSELVWDWATSSSNYTTLRAQHEAALGGKGWEIESSLSLAQQAIANVVRAGGAYTSGGGAPLPVADASEDYLPVTGVNGAVTETAEQVREDDLAALFAGMSLPNARVTRMRSDISHAAMTTDFTLAASTDQSELSNIRTVTQQVNVQCPIYAADCTVVGYGTTAQAEDAVASASSATGSAGCATTPAEPEGAGAGVGAIAFALGLVGAGRVAKRRRRVSERSRRSE